MWATYQPYADRDFLIKAREDFRARVWEMYLGYSLMERGHRLSPKKNPKGPDACVLTSEGRVWFEAVLPGPGTTEDKVTPNTNGEIREVPVDKIILRLRSVIEKKCEKYKEYLEKGIVANGEPFVIAICGVNIPSAHCEGEYPFIVKAVFPIGSSEVRYEIDLKRGIMPLEKIFPYDPEVVRHNQLPIRKDIFFDPAYSSISGVLYSSQGLYSLYDGFIFVHNPLATARLPVGYVRRCVEFWIENETLNSTST